MVPLRRPPPAWRATGFTHLFPVTSQRTPPTVAPAPEPGPIHGSRRRSSRWRTGSTAETAARTGAGPRLGGRGDEWGMERGLTGHCRASGGGLCLRPVSPPGRGRESVAVIRASFGAKGGTGCPCFARVSRVRACGAAGGRIAAARFARLIARARRHTHLARPFPPGSFSRPQPSLSAEKPKGGPGGRLSLLSFYTISPNVKLVWRTIPIFSGKFSNYPETEWAASRATLRLDAGGERATVKAPPRRLQERAP